MQWLPKEIRIGGEKKYFKTQKSSQNDVVRLYFTFFSHIPLALSVKKCYTYKKIIYNILYNRIVLFWRHSSSADGLCRKANTAEPRKIRPCGLKVLHSVSLQLHAPTPSTFILSDSQTPSTLNIHLSAAQSTWLSEQAHEAQAALAKPSVFSRKLSQQVWHAFFASEPPTRTSCKQHLLSALCTQVCALQEICGIVLLPLFL